MEVMKVIDKYIEHGCNTFTLQDLLDNIGHEIHELNDLKEKTMAPVQKEITLLRMFKSEIQNIIKRYQTLESIL